MPNMAINGLSRIGRAAPRVLGAFHQRTQIGLTAQQVVDQFPA